MLSLVKQKTYSIGENYMMSSENKQNIENWQLVGIVGATCMFIVFLIDISRCIAC